MVNYMSLYINIEEIKEKYKNGDYNCKIKLNDV